MNGRGPFLRDAPGTRRLAAVAATAASVLLAGCAETPPHVVVVLIDTLRADRIDAFGGSRGITPFLDSLANRSTVFQRAYAPSSWTSPSVASLFTSRYPSQHGVNSFTSVVAGEEATVAESFDGLGYATAGFSANSLIREELGFGQGFGHFVAVRGVGSGLRRRYERTVQTGARALAWIDARAADPARPVFLYLQVMDPHTPYSPSAGALRWAFAGGPLPDLVRRNDAIFEQKERELAPEERADIERLYDAEVRSMDRGLAAFFAGLEERGVLANSIVVVLSDHGEEFWEHGAMGHNNGLFEELIRVPLLVRLPGQESRADVHTTVSLLDVAPTLLDLVGAEVPAEFEGRSLRPLLGGDDDALPARAVLSEWIQPEAFRRRRHETAVVSGRFKLIADVGGDTHVYDLAADPGERSPGEVPEPVRAQLARALAAHAERAPDTAAAARREVPLDAETRSELRALGYLE